MNSRLQRQTQNIVSTALQRLSQVVQAYKTGNQAIGGDSAVMQLTRNASSDINAVSMAAFATRSWRVIFTPTSMQNAYADLTFTPSIGNSDGYEQYDYHPDSANTSDSQVAWIFMLRADSNPITLSVQFSVVCPDSGTLQVIAL